MAKEIIREVDISNPLVVEMLHVLHSEVFTASEWVGNRVPRFRTGQWWIAYEGAEPIAFAGLRPSLRWEGTGYLASTGVLPKFRGRGLQRRLIRKRLAACSNNGWHTAITDTLNGNWASMRSLIACGFKPYAPVVRWGDKSAVYWIRPTWKTPTSRVENHP